MTTQGIASAKFILCGEHSVVYGEPAISFPFKQAHIITTLKRIEGSQHELFSDYYTGPLAQAPEKLTAIKALVPYVLKRYKCMDALAIHIDSSVPVGRGLGSSAVVATSITRALLAYLKQPVISDSVLPFVNFSEDIAHGNPSGIDAITVVNEQAAWFEKEKGVQSLSLNVTLPLVVADTGIPSETRSSVAAVRALYQKNNTEIAGCIAQLGDISREIGKEITNEGRLETVGRLFNRSHQLLKQLSVSSPEIENLIDCALAHDALGAKLTGGGRGGCVLILCKNKTQAVAMTKQLEAAGAVKTWISMIGE
ncbi:mevalonate kinase [Brochothrix campestris]|uniref:Mevalonate kinase n=1 Tax=Brochothrix campestris FSL F6-1037 TaxID=1265861 RepID=W7CPX8_9LIST|nr:mevalonate kinase [Brochothrix campestris]EUJ37741.1 mevalonate kinase [Brochothrix campestris FSL F6-1037]